MNEPYGDQIVLTIWGIPRMVSQASRSLLHAKFVLTDDPSMTICINTALNDEEKVMLSNCIQWFRRADFLSKT